MSGQALESFDTEKTFILFLKQQHQIKYNIHQFSEERFI